MDRDQDKANLEQQIDENLRKVYQRTLNEEVLDRLLTLLQQLKEQDTRNEG